MNTRQKILSGNYRTKSSIPKTPKQKEMWKRATAIVVKESGRSSEKKIPWQLVTTIYKKADKAGKVPRKTDISNAHESKTIRNYSLPNRVKARGYAS